MHMGEFIRMGAYTWSKTSVKKKRVSISTGGLIRSGRRAYRWTQVN